MARLLAFLASARAAGLVLLLALLAPGLRAQPARGATTMRAPDSARLDSAARGLGMAADPAAATDGSVERSANQAAATGLVVPPGSQTDGVVVLRGPLDVYGTVRGDVLAASGDVTIHRGGRVTGDAMSLFGRVRLLDGGVVLGELRSMSGTSGGAEAVVVPATTRRSDPWHEIKLVLGWITVLLVIGMGVLVTASPYLDGVAEALEVSFSRALGVGLVGQMLVLPALLAVVVALTLTIVGVLAIPLAIVAFVFAVAGLVTLGFLAVAFVTGRSIFGGERGPSKRRATSARGEALRALTVGVAVYLSLWIAAAALAAVPAAAVVLRTVAVAATWVAATAGFGAALLSRAGTRASGGARAMARAGTERDAQSAGRSPYQSGVPGWQTPTPVHGVVAARRPYPSVPTPRE